ncbi:anti-repressor SinI family protein [Alkalicoccobacillus murimartini]|uniref:Sin domain-containing protein n=1 Tax=Alkalicoccobacillus murimartini TaxID=171685 RepID=A0ABT9YL33_9BACI|nr:anti-repressor SinI family protein [Alkalicoccobacillus murimartini]MDQ0208579.1 hypothetical protein [Alkalicoccobacillus murimartini]
MAELPKIVYILGGMNLAPHKGELEELDLEWINLMKEALESGVSIIEIRQFLKNPETLDQLSAYISEKSVI